VAFGKHLDLVGDSVDDSFLVSRGTWYFAVAWLVVDLLYAGSGDG
jgi:hypothetical protein